MSITDSNIRLTGSEVSIRPPAVAGMFYPENPVELERVVTDYLDKAPIETIPPKAIIVPHAGYIYSGPVAASAYASLTQARRSIKKVVLLGPAHRVHVRGLALPSVRKFSTPLGNIEIDQNLVDKILGLAQISIMDNAHTQEHSLEVHLPFLQTVLGNFTLIPMVVGEASTEEVSQVLNEIWGGDETLIVISSDLSHYHQYATAQEKDSATSRAIQNLELEKIGPHQACGCIPIRGLLNIARIKNMRVENLDLRNSGDTAGPQDRVVGYGSYALHLPLTLSLQQRQQLLEIAHQSIEQGFETGTPLHPVVKNFEPLLRKQGAVFVTLKINSRLRGCIGTIEATTSLVENVAENAFKAAFRDPRFPPLTRAEYSQLELGISVLSVPEEMEFTTESGLLAELKPDIDGLIIEKGVRRATFLPEVWETLPAADKFLNQLKLKAGIKSNETPDRAWRYHSEHFE